MKIRFKKIINSFKKITGIRNVDVYLVSLDDKVNANVQEKQDRFYILINYNNIKTEEMFIKALAHEFAHIVLHSNEENAEHQKKMEELIKKVKEDINA